MTDPFYTWSDYFIPGAAVLRNRFIRLPLRQHELKRHRGYGYGRGAL